MYLCICIYIERDIYIYPGMSRREIGTARFLKDPDGGASFGFGCFVGGPVVIHLLPLYRDRHRTGLTQFLQALVRLGRSVMAWGGTCACEPCNSSPCVCRAPLGNSRSFSGERFSANSCSRRGTMIFQVLLCSPRLVDTLASMVFVCNLCEIDFQFARANAGAGHYVFLFHSCRVHVTIPNPGYICESTCTIATC